MDQVDEENICRICLKTQYTLFSLFRKRKDSSPYDKLLTKINLRMNVDIGPSSICSQCLIELDTTVNFIEKCEKSNEILDERYTQRVSQKGSILQNEVINEVNMDFVEKVVSEEVLVPPVVKTRLKVPCEECGATRRCRHRALTLTCQHCHKVFSRKFNFQLHLKRHLGERDWPCPQCGAQQLTQWLADRHCLPRARCACPEPGCHKTFTTNTNLKTHMRAHTGERPFKCSDCDKCFTSKNALNDHLRIHTGAKPYMCPVCGKRFTTNKLSSHMWTHRSRASRPLACARGGCSRRFASAAALHAHARTHAPPAREHRCALCPAAYNHKQSLNKHLRKQHAQGPVGQPSEIESAVKTVECAA